MGQFLNVDDLDPFAEIDPIKATAMIEDAEALALTAAPCLESTTPALTAGQLASIRAILRGAILRWNEAGTGAMQSQTAGPFAVQVDTRQTRRGMFWPSEISQLQAICGTTGGGAAWALDTMASATSHLATCARSLGATYCDCGADIAGYPIYGLAGD